MGLNPTVWGSKFWFCLHIITLHYPLKPNNVTKKKYYDLIHNLPLFIPDQLIGNQFGVLLDKYPLTPYLDSRDKFVKWLHFIHNRVNEINDKEILDYYTFIQKYRNLNKPTEILHQEKKYNIQKLAHGGTVLALACMIYLYYPNHS